MARLPAYLDLKMTGVRKNLAIFTLKIRWWGWPVLFWKAIRQFYRVKWWLWPYVLFQLSILTIRIWLRGEA